MSREPVEIEHVEYMDSEGAAPLATGPAVVYQSNGVPCCSGCGCLLACIVVIMFFNVGSVFGGAVILLTALMLAGAALRLSGVKRYSPAFPYVLVPVFLVAVNLATRMFRGVYPYNLGELVGATLLIYVFLYLARGLGRR